MRPAQLPFAFVHPVICVVSISVGYSRILPPENRQRIFLTSAGPNLEDRHFRRDVNPEPFLLDTFNPACLIDVMNSLPMGELLRSLYRLGQGRAELLLQCR